MSRTGTVAQSAEEKRKSHDREVERRHGGVPPGELTWRAWQRALELVSAAKDDPEVFYSFDAVKLLSLIEAVLAESTPLDWISRFDEISRTEINAHRAVAAHTPRQAAIKWTREHYVSKLDEYETKTAFSQDYVTLVQSEFDVVVSVRVMCETEPPRLS